MGAVRENASRARRAPLCAPFETTARRARRQTMLAVNEASNSRVESTASDSKSFQALFPEDIIESKTDCFACEESSVPWRSFFVQNFLSSFEFCISIIIALTYWYTSSNIWSLLCKNRSAKNMSKSSRRTASRINHKLCMRYSWLRLVCSGDQQFRNNSK